MSKVVDDFVAMVRKRQPDYIRGNASDDIKEDMKKWGPALKKLMKKFNMPIVPELIELGDAMNDTYLLVETEELTLEFRPPDSLEGYREAILEDLVEEAEELGEDYSDWKMLPVFHHLDGNLDVMDFEKVDSKSGKCPVFLYDFYDGFSGQVAPSLSDYLRKLTKDMKEYEPEED